METLLSSPIITGAAATLGIGVIFLVLFATGRLPTPTERATLKDELNSTRQDHKDELAQVRAEAKTELDTVRVNLRKDLDIVRQSTEKQVDQERMTFQRELDGRDKIIDDLTAYIKQLVAAQFEQQDSIQKDVVPPLALLAQQLPSIIYALQELNRKRELNG